ncbi:flagellin [Sphaerobacter thermophilus]|uniref:Flagellin n=1 Tax=Sphaerobacter thermophilus (strain ATCC 49802 / DSM 20745 / KCCM 41009 / NCIMB 13125 / S 6022) TaxID=479434 RepID=D1C179_SPHTD|nr:flagellin [Sphaerobacter thermophilus]ACZ37996.1 flagellin domain protein [Sphaerobacter thermophilus DSM 20745]PZN62899.1 MAG: flagellin FliC [Sphaerobacter thermophilus]
MRINTNTAALNAQRNLGMSALSMNKAIERLSSGLRINRAADDAAGLSISEKMRVEIRGLRQAVRNAQDGISLVQTAEGALNEVHGILQRMNELSLQGANGTLSQDDQVAVEAELKQLVEEIDRIANTTGFNGIKLFNGGATGVTVELQIGSGTSAAEVLSINIQGISTADIGNTGGTVTSLNAAVTALGTAISGGTGVEQAFRDVVDSVVQAVKDVSQIRSSLGAYQNRLEHTINNLNVAVENLSASESRIRDADMAEEVVAMTRAQILQQAGTAVLAQANQAPQMVLSLLR